MNVLIDADALVALAKSDDSNHTKASAIAKTIQNVPIFLSPFTIPEATTVLSHRISQVAAAKFLRETRKQTYTVFPLTEELTGLADELFLSQTTKGTSWPDCLNMAIAKSYSIDAIFSFDHVYAINGFRVLS